MAVPGAIGALAAFGVRCTSCNSRLLFAAGRAVHRDADKLPMLTHGATAVVRIVMSKPITCLHCGVRFATRDNQSAL
jgi:hypothetical protein